jgi:hypothetical protein
MSTQILKAPFPYFGGKSKVADLVWDRLGDVDNFVEPFAGSLAITLRRPQPGKIETVNDANHYIVNFWRAVQADPDAVAAHADHPVCEADLHARHRYLVLSEFAAHFRMWMETDPEYYDAKLAGWWVWGQCCWIGGGWCDAEHRNVLNDQRPNFGPDGMGNGMNRPSMADQARMPQLSQRGKGITAGGGARPKVESPQLPDLSGDSGCTGRGVLASAGPDRVVDPKRRPALAHRGEGINVVSDLEAPTGGQTAKRPRLAAYGTERQDGDPGVGVCGKMPRLDSRGEGGGVTAKLPLLNSHDGNGTGVHSLSQKKPMTVMEHGSGLPGVHGLETLSAGRPQLGDQYDIGRGVNGHAESRLCDDRRAWLMDWMRRLQDRLRLVRVCYGHWDRICDSKTTMTRLGVTGAFLDPEDISGAFFDPPYAKNITRLLAWIKHLLGEVAVPAADSGSRETGANRSGGLYAGDSTQDIDRLVAEVHVWCRRWGASPKVRIALCGYEGEHDGLEELGWTVEAWKAHGGYANRNPDNVNKDRERIWFSPACLSRAEASGQGELFA